MSRFFNTIAIIIALPCLASGGDILFWLDYGRPSHMVVWKPLVTELAKRGHQITFVGPKDDKDMADNPNITYAFTGVDLKDFNSTSIFEGNYFTNFTLYTNYFREAQQLAFNLPMVQDLIRTKKKFDVAIFAPTSVDIGIYLAKEIFQAPIIMFFYGLKQPLMDMLLGNPVNPSYIPTESVNLGQNMTFWQRVLNTTMILIFYCLDAHYHAYYKEIDAQKLLGLNEKPNFGKIAHEASFGLFHSHPLLDGIRPMGPNSVDYIRNTLVYLTKILREANPIEDINLKKWLDEAEQGFIYVAYGTVLRANAMPESARRKLLAVFESLNKRNVTVLLKWEAEQMLLDGEREEELSNIMLKKWLPQQDVLGHPNCKLFITHGGLMSTYESLYHGVPMVVMPGFSDQYSNAARAVRNGYGKTVHWANLSSEKLLSTIIEALDTPSYQEKVNLTSLLLRDQLTSPLDRAVYHVEYIMRHHGVPFLKSPVKDLYWFQSLLLDMALLLLFLLLSLSCILYGIVAHVYRGIIVQLDSTQNIVE